MSRHLKWVEGSPDYRDAMIGKTYKDPYNSGDLHLKVAAVSIFEHCVFVQPIGQTHAWLRYAPEIARLIEQGKG